LLNARMRVCRQQVLGGEADRDSTDAPEGQQAADLESERLCRDQHGNHDGEDPRKLAERIHRRQVEVLAVRPVQLDDVAGDSADESHGEPGDARNQQHVAHRQRCVEHREIEVLREDRQHEAGTDDPHGHENRPFGRAQQGVVPAGRGLRRGPERLVQQQLRDVVGYDGP
jgi:hypothetical protein